MGNGYSGAITPAPRSFDQAVAGMSDIGARYIGVNVDPAGGASDANAMAMRTGSVDGAMMPLVYSAPAGTVSDAIIMGIQTLADNTPQDVNTRQENVAGNPDDFDATGFIKSITPLEGYSMGVAGQGYANKDATTFLGVTPGTEVEFDIDFHNDVRPAALTAEIFQAKIIVVGNGVADLDSRNVYIVVPPEGQDIQLL
jgi:hypothetical protein